jgi:LysR family cys regulon transcriptional activator
MKLQQLRFLAEVASRDLNVSSAAEALFTSQPGARDRAFRRRSAPKCGNGKRLTG